MLRPDYERNGIALYCGDCLEILPELEPGSIDAVVTDPPYGMRYVGHSGGGNSIHSHSGSGHSSGHIKARVLGDDIDFDPSPWTRWPCVLTGANWFYDKLPAGGSLHSWDKRGEYRRTSFADADIVWCSRRIQSQTFRLVWRGLCRHAENTERILHPTQKPVSLMQWMIEMVSSCGCTILDPFLGSGTTAIAAIRTGRRCISIEKEPRYFDIAVKRIEAEFDRTALLDTALESSA